jgi:hypothetical protein
MVIFGELPVGLPPFADVVRVSLNRSALLVRARNPCQFGMDLLLTRTAKHSHQQLHTSSCFGGVRREGVHGAHGR